MALVGKFAYVTDEDGWCITEVLEKISDELYLVDYKDDEFDTKYLVHAQDMVAKREDGTYYWSFFETMEAARKYTDWLAEGPNSKKVINIVRE